MTVTTRSAKPKDAFHILRLLKYVSDNERDEYLLIGPMDINVATENLSEQIDEGLFAVAEDGDGNIVGFLGVEVVEAKWSGQKMLANTFMYVAPDARKSNAGSELLKVVIESSKQSGLPFIFYLTNVKDAERKKKLLERIGFKQSGMILVYNPET